MPAWDTSILLLVKLGTGFLKAVTPSCPFQDGCSRKVGEKGSRLSPFQRRGMGDRGFLEPLQSALFIPIKFENLKLPTAYYSCYFLANFKD